MWPATKFLAGKQSDDAGRMVMDYWRKDHDWLEETHDYIQWAFPLPVVSRYNPTAPRLRADEPGLIGSMPSVEVNFRRNLTMMSKFYDDRLDWTRSHDHNHLRITRILKSTRLLLPRSGLDMKFYAMIVLRARSGSVNAETISIWTDVVRRKHYSFEDAING